jgi:hypothetical protein
VASSGPSYTRATGLEARSLVRALETASECSARPSVPRTLGRGPEEASGLDSSSRQSISTDGSSRGFVHGPFSTGPRDGEGSLSKAPLQGFSRRFLWGVPRNGPSKRLDGPSTRSLETVPGDGPSRRTPFGNPSGRPSPRPLYTVADADRAAAESTALSTALVDGNRSLSTDPLQGPFAVPLEGPSRRAAKAAASDLAEGAAWDIA